MTGSAEGIVTAASRPEADVLRELGVVADQGLSSAEVERRQAQYGQNAVSSPTSGPFTSPLSVSLRRRCRRIAW